MIARTIMAAKIFPALWSFGSGPIFIDGSDETSPTLDDGKDGGGGGGGVGGVGPITGLSKRLLFVSKNRYPQLEQKRADRRLSLLQLGHFTLTSPGR